MASPHLSFYLSSSLMSLLIILSNSKSVTINSNKNKFKGPITYVTKQLFFPDFNPNKNPRIHYDLKLLGSAKFSDQSNTIQIPDPTQTLDLTHQAGRAIYSSPVRLLDPLTHTPASFQTTFSFQFTTTNTTSSSAGVSDSVVGHSGSGFTFIIVPDEFTVGRPGPWLGMMNDVCDHDYKPIAVVFDTRQNLITGNPNDNHVGINLGTIVSSRNFNASDIGVSFKDGSVHRAWIAYDGTRRWIDIRLGSDGRDFPSKPIFSATLDISPYLNEYMFVGFSASTGNNLTQIHNVLSWNFSSRSQAHLRIPSKKTCAKKIFMETANQKPPSSFMIFVALVSLFIVVLLNLYCNGKRKDKKSTVLVFFEKKQRPRPPNKPHRFTISEIYFATRCFREREILSRDSRGIHYRGTLPNGCYVEVTRFSTRFLNSPSVDRRRVIKEIEVISQDRHPNLAIVRGWCFDDRETIVVYDYLHNGRLDRWLYGLGVLLWTRRFKVIKDVAESLSFLHSKKLAHKNVKTSSVLLDVNFRAILGDFGFVFVSDESIRVNVEAGQKADVFGFGILVVEIVAGRRSIESDLDSKEEMGILDFAWAMHEKKDMVKVVDQRIGSCFNQEQVIRVLEIGLLCTVNDSMGGLTMEEVVGFLNLEKSIPELPRSRPIQLFPRKSASSLRRGYLTLLYK